MTDGDQIVIFIHSQIVSILQNKEFLVSNTKRQTEKQKRDVEMGLCLQARE